jgi:hypothetical protein
MYILTRAAALVALIVAVLFGYSFVKKKQRKAAITAELESITSDSSFFQQFYAVDAQKTLVRAIGLIAEANLLGVTPETAINCGLGIQPKFFESGLKDQASLPREKIIRACLRSNYENFLKLGYAPDVQTLNAMKNGELPPIPTGPKSGRAPDLAHLINPALSPGMEKVIANLIIRPPESESTTANAIEISLAKQLACDLMEAGLIEESVRDHILQGLSKVPES